MWVIFTEDDFDQFLAGVKAKQAPLTCKGGLDHSTRLHCITSDSEEVNIQEEVDFRYREKITPLPKSGSPFADKSPYGRAGKEKLTKDTDLNLL